MRRHALTIIALVIFVAYANYLIAAIAKESITVTGGDVLAFFGGLIGSAITIVGAYWLFRLQNDTADRRHCQTVETLIGDVSAAGQMMVDNAATGALSAVEAAIIAYAALREVSGRLRAESASFARIAQATEMNVLQAHLQSMVHAAPYNGVPAAQAIARGNELISFARALAVFLQG